MERPIRRLATKTKHGVSDVSERVVQRRPQWRTGPVPRASQRLCNILSYACSSYWSWVWVFGLRLCRLLLDGWSQNQDGLSDKRMRKCTDGCSIRHDLPSAGSVIERSWMYGSSIMVESWVYFPQLKNEYTLRTICCKRWIRQQKKVAPHTKRHPKHYVITRILPSCICERLKLRWIPSESQFLLIAEWGVQCLYTHSDRRMSQGLINLQKLDPCWLLDTYKLLWTMGVHCHIQGVHRVRFSGEFQRKIHLLLAR